ncbi:APC family permease [Aeromicrobium sp. CF3.5]|uniref:APC family permease n=1 Tax=Aeromicrobium sp. CF3.5 TaxID=3373078 RepID=UPI003EE7714D
MSEESESSQLTQQSLTRTMRVPGLTVHYITSVIGTGLLILPGHAASEAGPLSLVAWGALIVYSYPLALIFARLSTRFPTSRGIPEFVQFAFGERAARFVSCFLVATLLVANPVLGLAAARYLLGIWDPNPSALAVVGVGFLIVVASVLFNLTGVQVSGAVQGLMLVVLVLFLVTVMVVAIPSAEPANLEPFAPQGWGALGPVLIICFFGFIGWENAAPVAEEVVNPKRTYPRAILVAVFAIGFLYFAMALTVLMVVPPAAGQGEQITAFTTLLEVASGSSVAKLGNVVAVVLLVLATNAWVLGTSRVVYSTAREGLLPRVLTRVTTRWGVPWVAILALIPGYGIPVGILALTGSIETLLITATSSAFLLLFLVTLCSAWMLEEGRALRTGIAAVAVVTAAILPFVGVSLLYAAGLAVVAAVMAFARR